MNNIKIQAKESNYKIIKKKWLLEILSHSHISLSHENGFIINNKAHWASKTTGNPFMAFSHYFSN
jgi:hypothetical protein